MKTRRAAILVLTLVAISQMSGLTASIGWEIASDSNGIKIFSRPQSGSGIDEFRGIVIIPAKLEILGDILRNVSAQPLWIADCIRSEIVRRINDDTLITYSIYRAPWPVLNRDVIMKSVSRIDEKMRKFSIEVEALEEDILPLKNDLVRIHELRGMWIFEEIGKDRVQVTYTMKINPGGNIPAWLANRTSRVSPSVTLDNLRKLAAGYSRDGG